MAPRKLTPPDTSETVNMILDMMNKLDSKGNGNKAIKAELDIIVKGDNELKNANIELAKFEDNIDIINSKVKKNAKISDYFRQTVDGSKDASAALEQLTKAAKIYNDSQGKEGGLNLKAWGNAYKALGGDMRKAGKKISTAFKAVENIKAPSIDKFKNVFNLLSGEKPDGFNIDEYVNRMTTDIGSAIKKAKPKVEKVVKKIDFSNIDWNKLFYTKPLQDRISEIKKIIEGFSNIDFNKTDLTKKQIKEFTYLDNEIRTYYKKAGITLDSEYNKFFKKIVDNSEKLEEYWLTERVKIGTNNLGGINNTEEDIFTQKRTKFSLTELRKDYLKDKINPKYIVEAIDYANTVDTAKAEKNAIKELSDAYEALIEQKIIFYNKSKDSSVLPGELDNEKSKLDNLKADYNLKYMNAKQSGFDVSKIDKSIDTKLIDAIQSSFINLFKSFDKLGVDGAQVLSIFNNEILDLKKNLNTVSSDGMQNTIDKANKLYEAIMQSATGFDSESLKNIKKAESSLSKMESEAFQLDKIDLFKNKVAESRKSLTDLLSTWTGSNNDKKALEDILNTIENLKVSAKDYKNTIGKFSFVDINAGQIESILQLKDAAKEYVKQQEGTNVVFKTNKSDINKLDVMYESASGKVLQFTAAINEQTNSMEKTNEQLVVGSRLGESFGATFKKAFSSFAYYFSLATILRKTIQEFKNGINTLKSFDSALTNISYTMDVSKQQLKDIGSSALQMAEDMSMSIDNAMKIYQIYANMQTTAEEINKTARPTAILSNLSGVDTSTASDQIQGILQQFNMLKDAEQDIGETSMHVVDVLDKISANIKVDYAKGIGVITDAVTAAGQVAYDAGLSFEQLAAITAKVAEKTREDGGSIGNAIKTITVRLSKASKLSGSDEVDNETLSNASKALHNVGVEVYNADGSFRELDVILGELSEKWDTLTDAQQSNISYEIAATRQTNKFKNILSAWTDSMELATQATEEQGNALANQEKWEESFAGKMQKLQTLWQEFWLNTVNSDHFKEFIDNINKFLEKLNEAAEEGRGFTEVFKALGVVLALDIGRNALMGNIKNTGSVLAGLSLTGKNIAGLFGSGNKDKPSILSLKEITLLESQQAVARAVNTKAISLETLKSSELTETMFAEALAKSGLSKEEALLTAQKYLGKAATDGEIVSTLGLSAALDKLAASISITKGALLGIIGIAIVGTIAAIVAIVDALTISVKEATEYMNEWNKTLDEIHSKLKKQKDAAEEAAESYAKLAKGVNTFNNTNISLSDEDYTEFIRLNNELAEQFPQLKTGIDEEGNAILDLGDDARSVSSKLEELIERQERLANLEIAKALPDTFKNTKVLMDDSLESIERYEHQLEDLNNKSSLIDNIISGNINDKFRTSNAELIRLLKSSVNDAGLKDLFEASYILYDTWQSDEYGAEYQETVLDFTKMTPEQRIKIKEQLSNNAEELSSELKDKIYNIEQSIKDEKDTYDSNWKSIILDNVIPTMHTHGTYKELSPADKVMADALVSGLSSETAKKMKEYEDPYEFIQKNIINKIDLLENSGLNIMDLFSGELSNEDMADLYRQIQEYFDNHNINIKLEIGEDAIDIEDELSKRINEISNSQYGTDSRYGVDNANKYKENINVLNDITKDLTQEQIKVWLKATEGINNITEAIEKGKATLSEFSEISSEIDIPWTKSKMIDEINNLSSGFDKLDEIYADIYDKGGFDFSKLSSKNFDEAFGSLGISYEDFIEKVSGHTDDITYVQDAFNALTTDLIKHSGILDHVTKENANVTQSMLEMYGVSNAQVLIEEQLYKTEAKSIVDKYNLANGIDANVDALINENQALTDVQKGLIAAQAAEVLFGNTSLNVESKIEDLKMLANYAYGAAAAMSFENKVHGGLNSNYRISAEEAWKQTQEEFAVITPVTYSGGKSTQQAKESAEQSKEIIDWIEVAIKRVQEEISRLGKVVSATYRDWSSRNSSILLEMEEVRKEMALQQSAYQAYMRDAEAIPLAENYKKLIREGALYAETITDKTLKKNIDNYKELYEKAIQAKDSIEELVSNLYSLIDEKISQITSKFDSEMSFIEHRINSINNQIDAVGTNKKIAGKSFYNALIEQENQQITKLQEKYNAINTEMANIPYGTEMWYNHAKELQAVEESIWDANNAILEYQQNIKEVAKLDFDDLQKQFENAISVITNSTGLTDNIISLIENTGHVVNKTYYEALSDASNAQITALYKEYDVLSNKLSEAMAAGDIKEFSEEWYEMSNSIASVKSGIIDATSALVKYQNALRQIDWDLFDRMQSGLSDLVDESQFLIDLLSYDKLFDEGSITDAGLAVQGLHIQNYETYTNAVKQYAEEIKDLQEQIENDPTNKDLIDRYKELNSAQHEAILSMYQEKEAIKDLSQNGFDSLLDKLKELIDKYKETLNAQKSLYDYSNSISEQTSNIDNLRKQIMAYSGDSSEETMATVQRLSAELKEAEKNLSESEYDRYIQDQTELLDNFYSDLEDWINDRLDNIEFLFEQAIEATNLNSDKIWDKIQTESMNNSDILTTEMQNVWTLTDNHMYVTDDILTSTDTTCLGIKNDVEALATNEDMVEYLASYEDFISIENMAVISSIGNVDNSVIGVQNAIGTTNGALAQISSNIAEYNASVLRSIASAQAAAEQAQLAANNAASVAQTALNAANTAISTANSAAAKAQEQAANVQHTNTTGSKNNYYVEGHDDKGNRIYRGDLTYADAQTLANLLNAQYKKKGGGVSVQHYAKGGLISNNSNPLDIIAKSLGEDHMVAAKEGERILTPVQNKNFEKLIKFTDSLGSQNMNIVRDLTKVNIPTISGIAPNTTNVGDVSINLPNVTNKQEFVSWLKNDNQVEKLIQSMTIGRIAGGNSFAKMKY